MIKLRDARYCNLKLLLIYLVIYGHLIEPGIWESKVLMVQYKLIYMFHMPLFSFLSGLFLNSSKTCSRQFFKMASLYFFLQTFAVLLGNGKVRPLTPYWHLWYLLSYSVWSATGWIWFRYFNGKGQFIILFGSVLVGCVAGLVPDIGREHSLSRTLVFFPYFWMGLICNPNYPWDRMRLHGFVSMVPILAVISHWVNQISAVFLYQAAPYGKINNGIELRLICYLLGSLICLLLLAFMPKRRFLFTRVGADTMPAYLIHAPIVLYIRELDILWPYHLLIAAIILYLIDKARRWHSTLYGIVPAKGGIADGKISRYI